MIAPIKPSPSLVRVPASASADEVLSILRRDGGLIVEKLGDPVVIDQAWTEIQSEINNKSFDHTGVTFAKESRRVCGLAGKSPTFATKLLTNPLYQEVAHKLLSKTTTVWYGKEKTTSTSLPQVTNTMAFWLGPGSQAQGLHRDDQCHHTRHPAKYETDLGIMFAGTPSRKANGATNVVPGSHLWDDERKPSMEEACPAELEKGDALIWLGSTYHGAGHNSTTDQYRLLLAGFMTPGWCRQDENQYLAIPLETIQSYPEEVQQLLGYRISRPYGGFVEQMEPIDFLKANGDYTKWVPGDLI
ncbi:PhyH-domain-containing protein [Aspergillus campestris IBT 28561]|uniref:PhyH-domain-containing protein n=1 Tax=Aspergillus campestris (strain IBT 28561) TaxID=1392248 RepID=A0A2I1D213_ASPC2|nr:PhyH-domain-containing protein [Aspergillus campestris IBT 28561]PKY03899.1 PhyH-domain-containing protein [Aspergillus campestris IBT 28561]